MLRQIERLRGHAIMAGRGRVKKQVAPELKEARVLLGIVDPQESAKAYADEMVRLHLEGNVAKDQVLKQIGIRSHAVDEDSVAKLMWARANQAIRPYAIGGQRLGHLILSPTGTICLASACRGLSCWWCSPSPKPWLTPRPNWSCKRAAGSWGWAPQPNSTPSKALVRVLV